jgi:hypothetical protein
LKESSWQFVGTSLQQFIEHSDAKLQTP